MPQFEVSIPYTGIQTRIVLADSPEEALEKAKNGDLFLLGGGDCAVDDHSEDIMVCFFGHMAFLLLVAPGLGE